MKTFLTLVLGGLLCIFVFKVSCQIYTQPEQIHLALGENQSVFVVTWVTFDSTNDSIVQYGDHGITLQAIGTEQLFVDGGGEARNIYMHQVPLYGLKSQTKYHYRVGSRLGWSDVHTFRTLPNGTNWLVRFAVFGDMGNKNARSIPPLQLESEAGNFDIILHVGDFAYNMDTENARYGDEFMRQIEPIAARVPYMVCPGNHEAAYNFSNYRSRFSMPGGDRQSQFYSFNVGPAHIIAISSEFYYYTNYGWQQIASQYYWLVQDLQEANKPENRALHPWIIVMGHRPMYCSNNDDDMHCVNVNNLIRVGIPYSTPYAPTIYLFGLEELFYKAGVDLMFWAHEHSYERMWPVYNMKVCNGTTSPYVNPPAPVHVVTGSAGCQEGEDPFIPGGQTWSAYRSDDYGYTRMNVLNKTHLYLEQVSVDLDGQVVDRLMYIRTQHGPGLFKCT